MDLRNFIIKYRAEHGLSQRQFSEACGMSNGYISMIERGENPKTKLPVTPTLTALKKMASGMGMTLSALLTEVDDMDVNLIDNSSKKKTALNMEGGLMNDADSEIVSIILSLSQDKKAEALRYLRYLAKSEDM